MFAFAATFAMLAALHARYQPLFMRHCHAACITLIADMLFFALFRRLLLPLTPTFMPDAAADC